MAFALRLALAVLLPLLLAAPARAQEKDDLTRGGNIAILGAWREHRSPATHGAHAGSNSAKAAALARLNRGASVGYTLYKEVPGQSPLVVDPSSVFREGDKLAMVIEPSIDGYVYIFYASDEHTPEMIFPDARLNGGENRVQAHRVRTIPTLGWFKIMGGAATERVYVVVAGDPLPGVPIGDDLVKYCVSNGVKTWKPEEAIWREFERIAAASAVIARNSNYGRKQSAGVQNALKRDLELSLTEDAPSVVTAPQDLAGIDSRVVIATLNIVHK